MTYVNVVAAGHPDILHTESNEAGRSASVAVRNLHGKDISTLCSRDELRALTIGAAQLRGRASPKVAEAAACRIGRQCSLLRTITQIDIGGYASCVRIIIRRDGN